MDEVAQWLLQISWIDLAVGTLSGLAAAGLLTALALWLSKRAGGDGEGTARTALEERRRLLLFCGDVKALTDLAIQRHMSDNAFLQRFQTQPCFEILSPHFGEKFREHLAEPHRHHGHSDLAVACREECERLERKWLSG
jgi:hypothetical protein